MNQSQRQPDKGSLEYWFDSTFPTFRVVATLRHVPLFCGKQRYLPPAEFEELTYMFVFQQQCDKYWGDVLSHQKHVQQGDIHIHLQDKLELAKLVIRTFHIRKVSSSVNIEQVYLSFLFSSPDHSG